MTLEQFRRMIHAPERNRQELEQIMRNALAHGDRERAQETKFVLDARFTGWDKPPTHRGGQTETVSRFGQVTRRFTTAKEAFVWLVERFAEANPGMFFDIRWETTGYVAVGKRRGTSGGAARNYFAQQPRSLFLASPHLAEDPNNFNRLNNGWYVNTNLSNAEKFGLLCRFAGVSQLAYERDWEWEVTDPSDALLERKAQVALAKKIWDEFEKALNAKPTHLADQDDR